MDKISYEMGRQQGYKKGVKDGEKTVDLSSEDYTFSEENNIVTITGPGSGGE